jgi:hypothetical protein
MNPEEDGITHINIYSNGKTLLGRLLSNFAKLPFKHPYGDFTSIEGFWYWLSVDPENPRREELRKLWGWEAKKLGRELRGKDWVEDFWFKKHILFALQIKSENPLITKLLSENLLPFEHYYVYNDKVIEPKEGKWILDFWNSKTQFTLK